MKSGKFIMLRCPINAIEYTRIAVNIDDILLITDGLDGGAQLRLKDNQTVLLVSECIEDILLLIAGKYAGDAGEPNERLSDRIREHALDDTLDKIWGGGNGNWRP